MIHRLKGRAKWNGLDGSVYVDDHDSDDSQRIVTGYFIHKGHVEELVKLKVSCGHVVVHQITSVFPNNPNAYTDLQCLALAYQAAIDIAESIRGEKQ